LSIPEEQDLKDIAEEIIALLPNFLRYARTRVSDSSEAEDLVHDVTLRMIEKASDLVSKQVDLLPYGITAIRNLAVDRSRLAFSSHASMAFQLLKISKQVLRLQ
jgi:DNA-directed RNA polymerase specialized sigma24 family protein